MTDLVIYYTRTNKTKTIAEEIAKEKDAQLLEVIDKTNRDGSIKFLTSAIDAMRGKKTSIEYDAVDLSEYDTIYIGSPVWASKATPAILEFVEENDFNNTNVVSFVTLTSNGAEKALDNLNDAIKSKGGKIIRSFSIITKNTDIIKLTHDALNDE